MKHSIVFSGNKVIWLDQDESKIIEQMNKQLERFYGDEMKVVSVWKKRSKPSHGDAKKSPR